MGGCVCVVVWCVYRNIYTYLLNMYQLDMLGGCVVVWCVYRNIYTYLLNMYQLDMLVGVCCGVVCISQHLHVFVKHVSIRHVGWVCVVVWCGVYIATSKRIC